MRKLLIWTFLLWGISTGFALAQLTLSSPQSRIVYQRNQANQGTVWVAGQAPAGTSRIEARLVPITAGQGSPTDWTAINLISPNKAFSGTIPGRGGWYQLEVRALADNNVLASAGVSRVGIGEVFIVSGQSNAFGNDNTTGAFDDRVSCLDFKDDNLNEQLLPVAFSHADGGRSIGPSNPMHIWGMLGDKLAGRLNVPILFLGAAQPGTSSEQWRRSAENAPEYAQNLFPYRRLGAALLHYASRTGLRSVLWHQGEGDVGNDPQRYFDNILFLINKSRQQTNYGSLAWVVSRATYVQGRTDGNIINAQNRLSNEVPNVFAGPSTDQLTGADNRPDDVHFMGAGLPRLTDLWDQSLNGDFFSRSQPLSPSGDRPAITTGYVLPASVNAGQVIYVPYVKNGPFEGGNQFRVQVLNSDGGVVSELGTGTGNPLQVTLPGSLAPGNYRVRVTSTQPAFTGTPSDLFHVGNGPVQTPSNPTQPTQPSENGGTPTEAIRMIGYKYDAVSHGFQLLVNATGPVEVRLQRIDGGSFGGETNWGAPMASADFAGFTHYRFYPPIAAGVGGVEPGRYRLSVRRQGDAGEGVWSDVTLLNGKFTTYTAGDNVQPGPAPAPTPPAPAPAPVQPTPPQPTTPQPPTPPVVTNPAPTDGRIRRIGYKYDAISHGFQLLADASGAVEMRLERLDGQFNETNWGPATASTEYSGYTYYRFYMPPVIGFGGVEAGRYRLSVRSQGDSGTGVSAEVTLQDGVHEAAVISGTQQPTSPVQPPTQQPAPPAPPVQPPVTSNPAPDWTIRSVGYKYDMPTHGFQLLADATVPVEMRLERLDGPFSETNWGSATNGNDYSGYNQYRYYAPLAVYPSGLGVGGVEPGRYRLSVRRQGDSGEGIISEVTLQNGVFPVYSPSARTAAVELARQPVATEGNWRVWPNPFVDEVTVSVPANLTTSRLRVVLTQLNGLRTEITGSDLRLEAGQLHVKIGQSAEAFYILQILDGVRPVHSQKLIRQPQLLP
ncbi:hypothetical protein DYU11_28185 [Fibrisoma montanum]|uniref:Sialate O-acetylesterase domain-containing protein n=1 Tax=Fibrisoma montanum TaxID=2305895 RepID=A0A418LYW4_9BACT|nr:sialate O-acetylesterase [Fibrisoma montanum]RIV18456.1 hypothetical protein DYU11_28185 [Fibrisoma montanum]